MFVRHTAGAPPIVFPVWAGVVILFLYAVAIGLAFYLLARYYSWLFKLLVGTIIMGVFLFFGLVFTTSAIYYHKPYFLPPPARLVIGVLSFIATLPVAFYVIGRRWHLDVQKVKRAQLEVPKMKTVPLGCPNCLATVHARAYMQEIPNATCIYCGYTFEITERARTRIKRLLNFS